MPSSQPKVLVHTASTARASHFAFALCGQALPTAGLTAELRDALKQLTSSQNLPKDAARFARAETTFGRGRRLSVTQLGPSSDCDDRAIDRWLDAELSAAQRDGSGRVAFVLPKVSCLTRKGGPERVLRRLTQAGYRFSRFRSPDAAAEESQPPTAVIVVPPSSKEIDFRRALPVARAIGAGMKLARDLGNTPPNVATPMWMATQARSLAKRHGMKAQVLTPREMERRGMGGILGVGQGSANPPRLVRLTYGDRGPKVALVGKGVTFDTGGISIKPSASMEEMKYDKCGACTVLGVAEAVAQLELKIRLSVFVPLAENMPDAAAYRPSDIVRCYNGKTVEIINTDAEGRMILADALAWACEDAPDHLLEYSTLTGACVVALGEDAAALFTPSDRLARDVLGCAETAGERLWRMPLWPEFVRQMKGTHSDLKNSGPRWGGANTAAAFLSQFVEGVEDWAHIDIAGPAYSADAEGSGKRGATGYAVPFTVRYLREVAQRR